MKASLLKIWNFTGKRRDAIRSGLLFSFLRSAFGVTQLLAILWTVEVITRELPLRQGLIRIVIATLVCILGSFFTSYLEQTATMQAGFYSVADQRVRAGSLLRRLPLGFFTSSSAGRITATLTTTLSGVETAAVMVMVGIVSGLFSSAALFLFMLFYEPRIGLLSGIGMVCYLLVVCCQMKLSRKNAPALQAAQSRMAENVLTFLQGIKVTKAFSFREGDRQLKQSIAGSRDANIRLTGQSMPSQLLASLTVAFFESLILICTLYFFFALGDISLVKAIVLILFSFLVYASLNQAGSMLSMIGLLDASIDEAAQLQKAQPLPSLQPEETPEDNTICLRNVSFSYGHTPVLQNITASLAPRSFTAIVGPSGSGKTTLCQLIARFRDVDAGAITIGGADIRQMDYDRLMEKISMVFQNVYLFEDTVANNIRFGRPDASMDQVIAAAKAARCHDFIMALPQGYDTLVEEGGSNLSGGEKQRISIARAMVKDAPIIILDEATSALDAENEKEILEAIDALTENRTVIMIAHRLQTVKKADQILVLQKGRLVQQGTHESLKDQPGLYRDFLVSRQNAAGWRL